MRPSFDQMFIEVAKIISSRSTCSRMKVGSVLVINSTKNICSTGYNGNASGQKNGCTGPNKPGQCGCLHAETNTLLRDPASKGQDKTLYITHQPCEGCAKNIINYKDIKRVVYLNSYVYKKGVTILKRAGIKVEKFT